MLILPAGGVADGAASVPDVMGSLRKPGRRDRLEALGLSLLIFGNSAARLGAIIGICPAPFKT